ncbi:MAG: YkgJ family cysteine cluster protein [Sphaerochaeta sp.]
MHCFYENGLRFSCVEGCFYCCSCEPGYVFLSQMDLDRLCAHTAMDEDAFIKTYCRIIDMGAFSMISLKEKQNYDCIFLYERGCSVYEARPRQCRTYPFWMSIMESEDTWEAEKKSCPGIGKGRLYTKEEIDELLKVDLEQSPIIRG